MRIESSIITSLSELRAIEQQRIAEERSAHEHARAAEVEAKRAAEQAIIDAEQARLRADRQEVIRIEIARAEAEREARLRLQAAELAEQSRLQTMLDQQRMQEELELRRAEVAKKRPTWMLAVTGIAMLAAMGLMWFAIDRSRQIEEAEAGQQKAREDKAAAIAEATEAREGVERIQRELAVLDGKVEAATKALQTAQTDADRKRAKADLDEARRIEQKAKDDAAARRRELLRKEREGGIHIDKKCLDNAIGEGCLKR